MKFRLGILRDRSGLKGRNNTAQGNALGIDARNAPALKGRNKPTCFGARRFLRASIPPLQGFRSEGGFIPRALPWAELLLPLWGGRLIACVSTSMLLAFTQMLV